MMRLGFALPQTGPVATADSVAAIARRAEEIVFDCLWVLDIAGQYWERSRLCENPS